MKNKKLILIGVIGLIVLTSLFVLADLEVYHNTNDNTDEWLSDDTIKAQNFTVSSGFTVGQIGLKLQHSGNNDSIVVRLYAANASGAPTGDLLVNGSINGSELSDTASWKNITTNQTAISSGHYVIILSVPTGSGVIQNSAKWRVDQGNNFASGCAFSSENNGSTWDLRCNQDFMFEIYSAVTSGTGGSIDTVLNYPSNDTALSSTSITFNATATPVDINLTNATFYVWYENGSLLNKTEGRLITGQVANDTTYTISGFKIANNYEWNVEVYGMNVTNDTISSFASGNYTFDVGARMIDENWTMNTFETANEMFEVNVTLLSGATLHSANLYYNGTSYLGNVVAINSTAYRIYKQIDIPANHVNEESKDNTFFWELIFETDTFTRQNLTIRTQEVNKTHFAICNSTLNIPFVNYTLYNETDRKLVSGFFQGTFEWFLGNGSVRTNYSANIPNGNFTFPFCASPEYETFNVSAKIRISNSTSGVSNVTFNDRLLYFNLDKYTNFTTETKLFLLDDSDSRNIIVRVTDQGLKPLENYYVEVERFYEGNNTYEIVERQKTDIYGQFVGRFVENTVKYRFTVRDNNDIIRQTTGDVTLACALSACVFSIVVEDTGDDFERFDNLTGFDYSFSFNNNTNIFTYTWNDATGDSTTQRLYVERFLLNGTEVVCNQSSTASAGTLTCNVGSIKASYKAQGFRRVSGKDERLIAQLTVKVGDIYTTFGREGLFWGFILLFTLIAVGSFNPFIGVMLYLVGFIGLGLLGIVSFNWVILSASLAIGIAFIWAIRS